MLTESNNITSIMDNKNIASISCFKQTKNVDIHADMYGTDLNINQCNFSLGLMEAGTYYVSRVMKREYGI